MYPFTNWSLEELFRAGWSVTGRDRVAI